MSNLLKDLIVATVVLTLMILLCMIIEYFIGVHCIIILLVWGASATALEQGIRCYEYLTGYNKFTGKRNRP